MAPVVGTPAEQTVHRDPAPGPSPSTVVDEPATVQACQRDFAEAHRPAGGGH